MTILKLAIRSLLHYGRRNLTLSAGVAISTTVLTGALIIGDSVKFSLEKNALYRLGEAEYAITAGDRYFTTGLAEKLEDSLGGTFIPVIKSEGMAIAEGGSARINNVQVWGVDEKFGQLSEKVFDAGNLAENKAVVSENLGDRLGLKQGDSFVLRIKKSSIIPLNAPFVSDDETSVSVRVTIAALAGIEDMGGFSLKNSQTLPFNVFLNQDFLNNLMGLEKKSNYIVIIAPESLDQGKIINALGNAWDPKDASLKITRNQTTGEWQLYSERVFIEPFISEAFSRDASAKRFILTWFVNGIRKEGAVTPYSFVSTLDTGELETDEVVVNNWLARDMNISAGEKIALDYYVVGPLRRLEERSINLEVKKIVPLTGKYGDPDLMPFLPGLSDAGHCRDWEAGIPIAGSGGS